jgi:4-oxalocrotonate tautomerase
MATFRLRNAWPWKSEQQQKKLAAEVTKAVASTLSDGEETVSVGIEEVPARDWNEKVYKAHILGKRPMIYKQPGYDPDSFQAEDDRGPESDGASESHLGRGKQPPITRQKSRFKPLWRWY